ncbi:MAG: efflux RND transporter periplasmic adaptor subunit [Bacteroidota bacterium]
MNQALKKYIPFTISALLFLAACGDKQKNAEKNNEATDTTAAKADTAAKAGKENEIVFTPAQYKMAGIETGKVEMRNLSEIIKLNGLIDVEPQNTAVVSAPMGGYIKTAGRLPGEAIKKGQILATIENPEFINMQQEYLESVGKLQYLEQEYKRQQKLREENVNAAKTFQQVTSDYRVMKARISGLEQKIATAGINMSSLKAGKIVRTANLYAPITGYIKTSHANIGKYANPTDVIFELINKDDMHLALNALEKDLGKIKVGQTVKFSSASENTYNRIAKIFLVGKASGEDGNLPVHCHIAKSSEGGLLPGMYVKAWIETGTSKQYAAPTDAIVKLESKDYLVLLTAESEKGMTFHLEEVKKGLEQEGYAAITIPAGMNIEKTKVVLKNAYAVLSALRNSQEVE